MVEPLEVQPLERFGLDRNGTSWHFCPVSNLSLIAWELHGINRRLARIEALLGVTMSQLDTEIASLQAAVAAETTVDASAVALLNGIPTLIANAVAQATAAGATSAQLAAITNLSAALSAAQAPLAAAVAANTPAAPATPVATAPST